MDQNQRRAVLEDARAELREARSQLSALNRRVAQLTQVVRGLTGLLEEDHPPVELDFDEDVEELQTVTEVQQRSVSSESAHNPRSMRPRDAVLEVLSLRPDKEFAPRDIVEFVREAGLFDYQLKSGANGYTTALNRLADDHNSGVVRTEDGKYSYHPAQSGFSFIRRSDGTLVIGGSTSE